MKWYYYLHTNGDLIGKNPMVIDSDSQYFDSPFVKKVWQIDTEDRADCWKLVLEALALGGRADRAKELAKKWGMTLEDSVELLKREKPTELMKKGMEIFVVSVFNMIVNDYWKKVKVNWE